MFTKRTQTFVFFCISVMAENEIKSREAKLDFYDDVLSGKKVKLEMSLEDNIWHIYFQLQCAVGVKVSNISK